MGMLFATFVEVIAIDGYEQLHPSILLPKTSELHFLRQQKQRPSAHHQRSDTGHLATGILFASFSEAASSGGNHRQQLWILLLTTPELHLPRQQQRSASAHHQRAASTKPWGQALLRPIQRAVCTAWAAASYIHAQLVVSVSAPRCQNDVTGCRWPPPTNVRLSLSANTPAFTELLYSSPPPTSRPPVSSFHNKPPDRYLSCGAPQHFAFPATATDVSHLFDNNCVDVSQVHAAAVARLQDDVVEAAKMQDGDTARGLTAVALLALETGELSERLLLSLGLDHFHQRLQRNCLCIPRLHEASHRCVCKNVVAAIELSPPLIRQSLELFLGKMAEYTEQEYDQRLNAVTQP
ncbi:uncharacterized protein [Dermacentor albipictus]|uniref:uncharacterized protein n=1 Tax=Dermacentor albipictus TaxID=60249 RepID=UPI0038FC0A5F